MAMRRRRRQPMVPTGISSYVPFYRGGGYTNNQYGGNYNQYPQQQGWNNATGGYQPQAPPPYPWKERDAEQNAAAVPPGPPPNAHVNGSVSPKSCLAFVNILTVYSQRRFGWFNRRAY